jgi:glucokinase
MSGTIVGAVDIGGTKIAVGVVDEAGRLLVKRETPTQPEAGFDAAMARIQGLFRECLQESGAALAGIGIGCTGPVDPFSGEIGIVDFLPGWQGRNLAQALSEGMGVSAALENDADAATLGEAFWGSGRGKATLLFVTVGTGIGGGLVVDGRLYRGVDRSHPELGHHVVDPSGPKCFCGASGCWEVLAAGPAMAQWAYQNAPSDYPHREDLSARRLCELASQGDGFARCAVANEARYLGLGIANLVTLFSPDMIVLGGNVFRSAHLFLPGIRAMVRQNCGLVPFEKTTIALASLGPDAPLIGAARVWHHRFTEHGD